MSAGSTRVLMGVDFWMYVHRDLERSPRSVYDTAIVHDETIRRTSERHHIRPIGSIHPNRPRATRLRQVRLFSFSLHRSNVQLRSLGYSEECLGLHYGDLHEADLGDGDGRKTEHFLARQHYFPVWGTCWESLAGLSLISLPFPQHSNS